VVLAIEEKLMDNIHHPQNKPRVRSSRHAFDNQGGPTERTDNQASPPVHFPRSLAPHFNLTDGSREQSATSSETSTEHSYPRRWNLSENRLNPILPQRLSDNPQGDQSFQPLPTLEPTPVSNLQRLVTTCDDIQRLV